MRHISIGLEHEIWFLKRTKLPMVRRYSGLEIEGVGRYSFTVMVRFISCYTSKPSSNSWWYIGGGYLLPVQNFALDYWAAMLERLRRSGKDANIAMLAYSQSSYFQIHPVFSIQLWDQKTYRSFRYSNLPYAT